MMRAEDDADRERQETILLLSRDKYLAHQALFRHRHPNEAPAFHRQLIELWHSNVSRALFMAFRGAAKSTLAEEGIIIDACFQSFKNGIILGETYDRACERLRAIKNEFETNPYIEDLFGDLVGSTWQEGKIILTNGVIIQAFGRGQSLRGSKHLDQRPDCLFGDDIEGEEGAVLTKELRQKTKNWFWGTVLPSLDPHHKIRVAATPRDPDDLTNDFVKKNIGFVHEKIPIMYKDLDGNDVASWPDRFPISRCLEIQHELTRLGLSHVWQQEYMCEAEDPEQKAFNRNLFKTKPQIKTWQATWAFYDPARTVGVKSASTGVAVWSWVNNKLIVWDGYGRLWKPDEIIEDIFKVAEEYRPVAIGVEQDGLEEFILQPIRQMQIRRGEVIPFRPMRAPRGKLDFIKGLQPFFKAGEIEFAKPLPELEEQLLGFPTGRIDIPNALAYALRMRPGLVIYEDFDPSRHVQEGLRLHKGSRCYVAVNATQFCVTAVCFQYIDGALHLLFDWVREGDPVNALAGIVAEVGLAAGTNVKYYAPALHFKIGDNIGLRAAARKSGIELNTGAANVVGRQEIQTLLRGSRRGEEALQVSSEAHWSLNALGSGYCKALDKQGRVTDEADDTVYKVLMEGLESVLAYTRASSNQQQGHYEYTVDGRRYLSARA